MAGDRTCHIWVKRNYSMSRELSGHYRYLVETPAQSITNDREGIYFGCSKQVRKSAFCKGAHHPTTDI